MKTVKYENFPDCAKKIRKKVFIEEQGFQNEYDDTDNTAVHFVLFDENEMPVATCRVFRDAGKASYVLGRLAVLKEYRHKNIGSLLIREAEAYVRSAGGQSLVLHSQCQAADFYRKSGFTEYGDIEDEQGCPHIWMRKPL
ncbi:GNAT family N-acetyltransferase [Acetatifactor aquisgranensis]|uniref:GNAT family N-acetyltransferase n=1 Tax=Acetatifactor aquisgranensis TaxID=2941233 RepID=UPI00203C96CF|nr:GNAT family N-acetyltransferase [Acetatifactor aquisgranensis]